MTKYYHSFQFPTRLNSVSHNLYNIFRLTLFACAVLFIQSCEEGPTKIGTDLLPGEDYVAIKATDTLNAWSYTMYDESVRSDNPSVSYMGEIYDPYFGTTTTEFVTEIRMGGPWVGGDYTIDSVRLFLTLLDVRGGGTNDVHELNLYEIDERLYTDSVYYSDKVVPFTDFEVKDISLPYLKPDTINEILINLPLEVGEYLLRDTSKLFYSNTKDDFRSFFKGFNFQLTSIGNPLLVSLSLSPSQSGSGYNNLLIISMHNETGEYREFFFILDAVNRNASYNKISHNFTSAILGDKMEHRNDLSYRDTLSYLQNLSGVYTKLILPGLQDLKNDPDFKNIGINRAQLTIPVFYDGTLYKASTIPTQLYLRYSLTDGTKYFVPDYNIDQYHSFFGGKLDSTANVYRFNLASFVQLYLEDLSGEIKPELEVFQLSSTRNVILKANRNETPGNFELTYSQF